MELSVSTVRRDRWVSDQRASIVLMAIELTTVTVINNPKTISLICTSRVPNIDMNGAMNE